MPVTQAQKRRDSDGLTVRERRFVDAFAGNASEAARVAGYKQPQVMGSRVLGRPSVGKAIAKRDRPLIAQAIIKREEVEEFLAETMKDAKLSKAHRLKAAEQLTRLNAYDKAPSSVVIPVIGIKIET